MPPNSDAKRSAEMNQRTCGCMWNNALLKVARTQVWSNTRGAPSPDTHSKHGSPRPAMLL